MSEFSNIMERIKTEKLAEYLLYGSASDREREDFYENSIENSYNEIFNKLAEIYPVTDGEKEKLYEAVMDFSIIQSEIYFEMGLSAGFHLYKNFDSVSRNRKTDGSDSDSL